MLTKMIVKREVHNIDDNNLDNSHYIDNIEDHSNIDVQDD